MLKLILSAAIWLSLNGFYSESSIILSSLPNIDKIGISEYYEYHFFQACNNFIIGDKEKVQKHCLLITESFNQDCPRRYKLVAIRMFDESKDWKAGDLLDISRDMKNSENLLDKSKSGVYTQYVQSEAVRKLNKQIKDIEDAEKAKSDAKADQERSDKGENRPNQHSEKSEIVQNPPGKGEIDQKKLAKYAQNWGSLPPLERQKAITEMSRDLPPKYRIIVEDYFKALSRTK